MDSTFRFDLEMYYSISESLYVTYSMSDPTLSDIKFKNSFRKIVFFVFAIFCDVSDKNR